MGWGKGVRHFGEECLTPGTGEGREGMKVPQSRDPAGSGTEG